MGDELNAERVCNVLVCLPIARRFVERLRAADARLCVDVAPPALLRALGVVLPEDLTRWFLAGDPPPADDERSLDDLIAGLLAPAEVIVGLPRFTEGALARAERLRWLQFISAGVERFDLGGHPDLMITNGSGTAANAIAEYVIGMMFLFARDFPRLLRSQAQRHWDRSVAARELTDATCGVVGLGAIGGEVARRAKALGMRVIAIRRSGAGEGAGQLADIVLPPAELPRLLRESDYVVLAAPLTPATHHLIGGAELAQMKRSAVLINVGRGRLVDEAALCTALADGAIAGAGLDVFETEPLPADSPLWTLPNVVVTAHMSAHTERHLDRVADLVCDNLRRYLNGEPLRNVVDRDRGY